jgi:hypothetical protein
MKCIEPIERDAKGKVVTKQRNYTAHEWSMKKRREAEKRQANRDQRTPEQQLKVLDLGNHRAERERARLCVS